MGSKDGAGLFDIVAMSMFTELRRKFRNDQQCNSHVCPQKKKTSCQEPSKLIYLRNWYGRLGKGILWEGGANWKSTNGPTVHVHSKDLLINHSCLSVLHVTLGHTSLEKCTICGWNAAPISHLNGYFNRLRRWRMECLWISQLLFVSIKNTDIIARVYRWDCKQQLVDSWGGQVKNDCL